MTQFWSDARKQRFGVCVVSGLLVSFLLSFFYGNESTNLFYGADLPGFFCLGQIVRRGLVDQLYNFSLQQEIQNGAWPYLGGSFHLTVYPPYFAVLLAPLSALGHQGMHVVWVLLSLLCFFAAIILVLKIKAHSFQTTFFWLSTLLLSSFLITALLGCQTTPLSMVLLAVIIHLLWDRPSRPQEFLAGLCAGLWLFKPQFGLICIGALFLTRRIWIILGSVTAAILYYLIAVAVFGFGWIAMWLTAIKTYSNINLIGNGYNQASVTGALRLFLVDGEGYFGFIPVLLSLIGLVAFGLLVKNACFFSRTALNRQSMLLQLGPCIALLSPQTIFYDLSFALIPLPLLFSLKSDRSVWGYLVLISFCSLLTYLKSYLEIPVLVIVCVGLWMITLSYNNQVNDKESYVS